MGSSRSEANDSGEDDLAGREAVLDYLADHPSASSQHLAEALEISPLRVETLLTAALADDLIVRRGAGFSLRG